MGDEGGSGALPKDVWASGEAYEPYVGRWSRLVARQFLEWLDVPAGSTWLDVGCGTGALTETILNNALPSMVKGIDSAEGFIAYVRGKITDRRTSFQLGDACALPIENERYDAAVSGFVLNFVSQPERMVAEMARSVKPGGVVAIYIWDYAGAMQFMRHFWNAAVALNPQADELDEGKRFPMCNPESLVGLFQNAGLHTVLTRPVDIWTVFKDFVDYWQPFLGGQGSAPSYLMSLSDAQRALLRDRIHTALPFAVDGSIPLVARAWAVRGIRPE